METLPNPRYKNQKLKSAKPQNRKTAKLQAMENQFVISPEFLAQFLAHSERRRQLFLFAELAKDAAGVRASTLANLCALFRGDVRLVRTLFRRRVISKARLTRNYIVACSFSRTVSSDSSFGCDGVHMLSFGCKGSGPGELLFPVGCALSVDACYVYVADYSNHRVCVFDASSGVYRHSFGSKGSGEGQFNHPMNVTVSDKGQLYVCDSHNHRVQVLDAVTGAFVRSIRTGTRGSELNQLKATVPVGVVVSRQRVYVCENHANNNERVISARVSVLDESTGAFLHSFGTRGSNNGQFQGSISITANAVSGNVYVVDSGYATSRVQVFNEDGEFERVLCSVSGHTNDVCVSATHVFVTSNQCVRVFDSSGAYVRLIDKLNMCACGVSVSRDGRLFVVDNNNRQVHVYQ